MGSRTFPLVRGRKMRVTRLDGCGQPVYGDCAQVVTEGFISVGLSAQINEGESITVTTANGKTCVNDAAEPEFQGYTVEVSFCNVDPELFALITGQEQVEDISGNVVGFRQAEGSTSKYGFALEVWAGVPGQACGPAATGDPSGYLLLPFLKGGVLGDFTIENAAVTFAITGAATKSGSGWGVGPYAVADGANGALNKAIGLKDHLHVQYTEIAPPEDTDGCVPVFGGTGAQVGASSVAFAAAGGGNDATATLTGGKAVIDWGDGTVETVELVDSPKTHTYAAAGTYVPRYMGAANVMTEAPAVVVP